MGDSLDRYRDKRDPTATNEPFAPVPSPRLSGGTTTTRHGEYDLGPIKFYYFDPRKKAYDSLSILEVPVRVTGEDLENIKLKQSGEDAFYSDAILSASNGLERDAPSTTLLFLAPIILVLGGVAYHIFKRRKPGSQAPEVKKNILD